jgi:hypothetical protein
MKNYVAIKFVSLTKTPDGAGGFGEDVEETLYETRAVVKAYSTSRTADAIASEVNYGVQFDLFLPPNLHIGTHTPVYIGNVKHAIVGVEPSAYPPIKHTVKTIRRDQ